METHAAQSRVGAIQGVQRIQRQPRGILEIKGGQSFNTEIEEWLVDFENIIFINLLLVFGIAIYGVSMCGLCFM